MQTKKPGIEEIFGDLREGYSQLRKGSLLRVDQLFLELQDFCSRSQNANNPLWALRQWAFWEECDVWNFPSYTAEGHGYFLREDGGVDWVITTEEENLVLRHIDDEVNSAYDQLVSEFNYRPDNAEAEAARNAEGTVVIDMSKLRLSKNRLPGDPAHINIDCAFLVMDLDGLVIPNYNSRRFHLPHTLQAPNEEEKKAMTRLGYTDKTFNTLRNVPSIYKFGQVGVGAPPRILELGITVVDPEYVARELKGSGDNSLWMASCLHPEGALNANVRRVDLPKTLLYFVNR